MPESLRAFHNDPAIKAYYLARVRAHRAADELIHGTYWEHGRGCAVGCTLHSDDHSAYERELGIPTVLARLEDGIFEALPSPDDLAWPEQFLEAIPVGADLTLVWPRFALALLSDPDHGVLRHVQNAEHARQRSAIEAVVALCAAWIETGQPPERAAAAAAAADAYAAAAAAADAYAAAAAAAAAAYAADAYAAYAARAAAAAAYAAYAARADRAAAAAYAARQWQAQTLLALLRAAPVPEEAITLEEEPHGPLHHN